MIQILGMSMSGFRRFAVLLSFLCLVTGASAKRSAPAPVPVLVSGDVVYSAPHEAMGYVVATDAKTLKELWRVQVYTVKIDPELERDVQDVFITSLALKDGSVAVTNEKGSHFMLDPATRKVAEVK